MSKYLLTTLPTNDLGLPARSLPIAQELRKRGHQVTFCNPAQAPSRLISGAGFDNLLPNRYLLLLTGDVSLKQIARFLTWQHRGQNVRILLSLIRHMSKASTAEIWDTDHFMYLLGMWNERFIRVNVEALIEVIRTWEPDAIVDFWNPFACIAARASHKPLITVIQPDMHPQSQGFIWWKKRPPLDLQPSPVLATNQVLADYHLPLIEKIADLLVGDMTLVLGLPEMDPLPETARVTYIGAVLWQKPEDRLPAWIEDLDREQPVIWLYPGNLQYMRGYRTFGDSAVVLEACIEALADEAVQVILTTGYHPLPRRFVPLPSNFRHEPYVPGLAMAEKSDLLIHHGGYASSQMGLYAGKPALILPTFSERESNARRIAAQGAGDYIVPQIDATGRKKWLSAQEVRTRLFNILSDASYAENAKRIGERMKACGGAAEAARLIEKSLPG
mgnify:CR=1 FL=1